MRLFDDSDFERFMTLVESPTSEWTLAGGPAAGSELKADEVRVERRPCPKGQFFDVFRVTTAVDPAPFGGLENAVKHISSVLLDSAYRKTWDARCACNGTLAKLGKANYVGFYGGLAPTPISSRDFCTLKSWRYNYKGKALHNVFLNHSIKWQAFPPQDGFIRARSFQTGNVLRKRDDGLLEIVYLTQSDIKGWIPQYVVNYVTSIGGNFLFLFVLFFSHFFSSSAPEMMKKVVQAALGYSDWVSKEGRKAAYDELHPDNDSDEVIEEYGPEHRY